MNKCSYSASKYGIFEDYRKDCIKVTVASQTD